MLDRSRKYKVGLFVIFSGLIFVALLAVAIGPSLGKTTVNYVIHFQETVKGMVVGSPVNFQGVNIGNVADMRFRDGLTEVTIAVDPQKAAIQTGSRARLDRAWVTGQVTVEISGYEREGKLVEEGGVVKAELSTSEVVVQTLPAVMDEFAGTLHEYRELGANLNALLSEKNRARFAKLLDTLDRQTESLGETWSALGSRLETQTLPEVKKLLSGLSGLTPELENTMRKLGAVAINLRRITSDPALTALLTQGRQMFAAVEKNAGSLGAASKELAFLLRGNQRKIQDVLAGLGASLQELQGLLRVLRATPSALVFGKALPRRQPKATAAPASAGRK